MRIFLFFNLWVWSSVAHATPWTEGILVHSYGEWLTLEKGYSSSAFVKAKKTFAGDFRYFVGTQWETYQPDSNTLRRFAPSVGIELPLGPFTTFLEYRYLYERPRSTPSPHDPRLGLVGGYWWQSPTFAQLDWFCDSYTELISSPRIRPAPTLTGFSKFGLRKALTKNFFADPYFEAYGNKSPDPLMGRDALELRYGARLVWAPRNWSAQMGVFRRFATFVEAPGSRWRFLLAIGGTF